MKCTATLAQKNAVWIWIAVGRYAKEFINFTIGDRLTKTGNVPENKYIQSKAHTYTVGRYNSLFRHFLARMRRKSKYYSKSKEMLEYSVKLLILKRNGLLSMLD